jgi:two-component system response regulator RegX3
VQIVHDGDVALVHDVEGVDLVILDVVLPNVSGFELCREYRARSQVPILMLTVRASETDRAYGLEIGADDYVCKPFSMTELSARVRAMLRRRALDVADVGRFLECDWLRVDLFTHRARVDGADVSLTPIEWQLLVMFAREPGRTFTRADIIRHLWHSTTGSARSCDTHIKNLRRKIEVDSTRPERIVTVRGIGYQLHATT